MDEPLSQEEEKVFEWIAEQALKKRTEMFFEEAMKTLDIADVMTMNFILEKLKGHWGNLVIEKIQYGALFRKESFSFTINYIDAPDRWKAYKNQYKKEEKPKCPKCGKSIENTFRYCPNCSYELDKQ